MLISTLPTQNHRSQSAREYILKDINIKIREDIISIEFSLPCLELDRPIIFRKKKYCSSILERTKNNITVIVPFNVRF